MPSSHRCASLAAPLVFALASCSASPSSAGTASAAASVAAPAVSSAPPGHEPGSESHELFRSLVEFFGQRAAPAAQAPALAWPAAVAAAQDAPVIAGTWEDLGPYAFFTDNPDYVDPAFSNNGAGGGNTSGRITSLALGRDGQLVFAGAADGGIWKSTDAGLHWVPVGDALETLSIGALALQEPADAPCAVYAGTGEANTSADSYAGVGILKSSDCGTTWARSGGDVLVGALIWRLVVDPRDPARVYAATSHGLYRSTDAGGSWQPILAPSTAFVGNHVTDVAVRPGTGGATGDVLAVIGWRDGYPTNGLYESHDGGDHFVGPYDPQGYVAPSNQGRVSLAWSSEGSRLYAVVQDPTLFSVPGAFTELQAVYLSATGDPKGPFAVIANSAELMNAASAMKVSAMGKGYQPGIQAWYNQFIAVDPGDRDHVYLGLEEVYETLDAGLNWSTVGPYWNFTLPCFSYTPFMGTCTHTGTHPDQHAAAIAAGKLFVGNDGGVFSRALTDHAAGDWLNLNATLGTLQFYGAGAGQAPGGPLTLWAGSQDNGTALVIPPSFSAEPMGGDGGMILVDATDPDRVISEFPGLGASSTEDGGHHWTYIAPPDPSPRFVAPLAQDATAPEHLVAGGRYVWESTRGFDTKCDSGGCDWKATRDLGAGRSATAVAASGKAVWAAWCGPCNPNMAVGSGAPFQSGMATSYGGSWHAITPPLSTRFPTAIAVDPANAAHAYATYSGYSRRWILSPLDPGVGHVFETENGGDTWSDVSGDLVDAPANDIVIVNGGIIVATDLGVFAAGSHGGSWSRLGSNLPNVVVDDLALSPAGDQVIAATHGRGLWMIPTPALSGG